ncbi:MAG: hypothetical protein LIP23_02565 [Planctomycetes bacterium]|nr:hypothetical protein [Planctomycetota bacterium]
MNMDSSDVKRVSFWVSQLFIIVATVLGVYLAATQGLKQALQFDAIKGEQNNYYLRKSLQNELADNVGYIREYIGKVDKRIQKPSLDLETFVWNSMTYSSTALEMPSTLLREAQKFYHRANDIMNTPHFNDMNKAKALGELADHVEKSVLPLFEADTEELRKRLQGKNVGV